MSEVIEEHKKLSFDESITVINNKYIIFLEELIEKFKYHDDLIGPLENDLKLTKDKLPENNDQVLDIITDNFLFCLEQIYDHNEDYFIYQKDKIHKKNGKVYKNKLPKIGNRTLLKKLLKESDNIFTDKIFKEIIEYFNYLIYKDKNDVYFFNSDYIDYVKENFSDNKNYSKMIMVFDNVNNIFNSKIEENEDIILNDEETKPKKGKSKEKAKGKQNDFMKNLENTKIAQLAKNISEKININDFPALSDPSKLLSSLGNSSEDGGIQNLLKFVVGEVEQAFKTDSLNEKDLMGEAQNIMGDFQNMSGFDPMSLLKGNDNIDLSQFANIFSKMSK